MVQELVPSPQPIEPPAPRYHRLDWARQNLFSTWYNTLLTLLAIGLSYFFLKSTLTWVVYKAHWEVVETNLRLLMVGTYPASQVWRAWLLLYLLSAIIGLTWGVWIRGRRWLALALLIFPLLLSLVARAGASVWLHVAGLELAALLGFGAGRLGGKSARRIAVAAWVLYFPLVIIIVRGLTPSGGFLPFVPTNFWGGLLLTFLLTAVGISFSFPLGVLLALGRRSKLPAIRWVSVVYIEVIRGVPLVTILFMAQTMVPFFLPSGITIDRVLRAMVGIILFSAAYLAEIVRGGLQAIPHGQYEAAYALGLSGTRTMGLIILPQALRAVIPVLVGLFIALFKDTSLVATVGLLELLGISRSILAQPAFVAYQMEVFLFISLIYWTVSFFMSNVSRRLEVALGVGVR